MDAALADEPLVGDPPGVRELLAALPGEGEPEERMTLIELLPAELKRASDVRNSARRLCSFACKTSASQKYGPVFMRVESGLQSIQEAHPNFVLALDGSAVWRWRNVYRIITDLAASLGTASLIILLILTVVYRSIRIGLISIVPNLFPLVATGAMLVMRSSIWSL